MKDYASDTRSSANAKEYGKMWDRFSRKPYLAGKITGNATQNQLQTTPGEVSAPFTRLDFRSLTILESPQLDGRPALMREARGKNSEHDKYHEDGENDENAPSESVLPDTYSYPRGTSNYTRSHLQRTMMLGYHPVASSVRICNRFLQISSS